MSAIQEFSRYDILFSQFPYRVNSTAEYDSLIRVFQFLYENTNINHLVFLREDTLVQYLKYHKSKQFKLISFTQVIHDLKIFIAYLANKKRINKELILDLSLKNNNLWRNL